MIWRFFVIQFLLSLCFHCSCCCSLFNILLFGSFEFVEFPRIVLLPHQLLHHNEDLVKETQPVDGDVHDGDTDEAPARQIPGLHIRYEVGEHEQEVGAGEQRDLIEDFHVIQEGLVKWLHYDKEHGHHQTARELDHDLG
jgi:hypothetical protein